MGFWSGFWIGMLIGVFLGAPIGMMAFALAQTAKRGDHDRDNHL